MAWLAQNWFWVLIFFGFIAMHLFGHGGQGSMGEVAAVAEGMASTELRIRTRRTRAFPAATGIEERAMLNIKLVSWALGLWGAITFIVCVVYGLVTPQSLHMLSFCLCQPPSPAKR